MKFEITLTIECDPETIPGLFTPLAPCAILRNNVSWSATVKEIKPVERRGDTLGRRFYDKMKQESFEHGQGR